MFSTNQKPKHCLKGANKMTRNLKIFTVLVVLTTGAYLALDDLMTYLPKTAQTIGGWIMLLLFFYIVFNLVYKVIYRLVGVTSKLMFRGWSQGWPRITHQQAAEINKYWLVWLGGSIFTYVIYTLLFHREQWKSALIFGFVAIAVVTLARMNSKQKIAGHTKEEIFK